MTAESGPLLAGDVVALAGRGGRLTLDYSVRSLALVDRVIEGIRRQGTPGESVKDELLGFGAYAGEVLVRGAGGEWVDFDEDQRRLFTYPFGVRTPDGRVWNPLGKAFKRHANGPEDSLHRFCLAVLGRAHI
jgi:hypothetical protein